MLLLSRLNVTYDIHLISPFKHIDKDTTKLIFHNYRDKLITYHDLALWKKNTRSPL